MDTTTAKVIALLQRYEGAQEYIDANGKIRFRITLTDDTMDAYEKLIIEIARLTQDTQMTPPRIVWPDANTAEVYFSVGYIEMHQMALRLREMHDALRVYSKMLQEEYAAYDHNQHGPGQGTKAPGGFLQLVQNLERAGDKLSLGSSLAREYGSTVDVLPLIAVDDPAQASIYEGRYCINSTPKLLRVMVALPMAMVLHAELVLMLGGDVSVSKPFRTGDDRKFQVYSLHDPLPSLRANIDHIFDTHGYRMVASESEL